MSGIDKVFDYVVPQALQEAVSVGSRVRVDLHGRRVSGWIVALADFDPTVHSMPSERLLPIASVSGVGVPAELVDLTRWVSSRWWGPWRAVLTSASAPRTRPHLVKPVKGHSPEAPGDVVAAESEHMKSSGGGLLVVPPCESALHAVAQWAISGPVLVVCPTVSMAVAGAAALRRRGFSTALVPDDWEKAAAGVDVVIGARSAVFAPCADLSGIIVIDEHDELLQEERVPTWDATSVAIERARRAGVPFMATSAAPSLRSRVRCADRTKVVSSMRSWPKITVVDLDEVPVRGSLLSTELMSAVRQDDLVTICVLNTKGKARLIVCKSCRTMQTCVECGALLAQGDDGQLSCPVCGHTAGGICSTCGRTAFVVPRVGVSQLRSELELSTGVTCVEMTGDSVDDWSMGRVFIGTEAVLHRVRSADCIVFADIDRDLGAPRLSATQEVLGMIAKAARTVGSYGSIVIQTRQPNHRLLRACASSDVAGALEQLATEELATRRELNLPPYADVVRVSITDGRDISEAGEIPGIQVARDPKGYLLRGATWNDVNGAVMRLRSYFGTAVRINGDPLRY